MKKSVLDFTRQLSMLMKSGISILKSLDTIYEQMPRCKMKKVVQDVIQRIQEGEFLSEAFEHHMNVFPQIYINMIRAGEISGKLASCLKELSDFLMRSRRLKQKVVSSVMYPLLILVTSIVVLSILMIFVVPSITKIFEDLGGDLPPVTLFLISASGFFGKWGYLFIFLFAGFVFLYFLARRSPRGAYKINIYRWKIPVMGSFLKDIAIERFCHSLGVMLSSGVPLVKSMVATKEVVVDPLLKEAIDFLLEKVEQGQALSASMQEAEIFPLSLVRIVNVAEEGGKLSSVFLEIASDYEEDISTSLSGIISLLEPLLILLMGVIVGFIVISLFFPIFTIGGLLY
ncbi:MAG: type II secretion system F family protein [Candidatus Omnitrophica bacterium]|nr:type II secretion system F family protein [Candidatus Omnitrophota bacterium]